MKRTIENVDYNTDNATRLKVFHPNLSNFIDRVCYVDTEIWEMTTCRRYLYFIIKVRNGWIEKLQSRESREVVLIPISRNRAQDMLHYMTRARAVKLMKDFEKLGYDQEKPKFVCDISLKPSRLNVGEITMQEWVEGETAMILDVELYQTSNQMDELMSICYVDEILDLVKLLPGVVGAVNLDGADGLRGQIMRWEIFVSDW